MDHETVKAKMQEQVESARKLAETMKWVFTEDDLILHVEMRHRRKAGQAYLLRVSFDNYPSKAPSYFFPNDPPPGVHHNHPTTVGICTPGTREFHEVYHLNDTNSPWQPEKISLRSVLMNIQILLEKGLGE